MEEILSSTSTSFSTPSPISSLEDGRSTGKVGIVWHATSDCERDWDDPVCVQIKLLIWLGWAWEVLFLLRKYPNRAFEDSKKGLKDLTIGF